VQNKKNSMLQPSKKIAIFDEDGEEAKAGTV
jgi:hypothetical protein